MNSMLNFDNELVGLDDDNVSCGCDGCVFGLSDLFDSGSDMVGVWCYLFDVDLLFDDYVFECGDVVFGSDMDCVGIGEWVLVDGDLMFEEGVDIELDCIEWLSEFGCIDELDEFGGVL